MDRINQVWPKWKTVEILGEGGFGKVYKAKRETFGQVEYSAIKVIQIPNNQSEIDEMTQSGVSNEHIKQYYYKSVEGLLEEIKTMSKLKSASHIVGIEDYEVEENKDSIGWTIFIRMELLTNILKVSFDQKEVRKMALDILTALEYCHSYKIMHRDIKPANIFVSEFGEYKLGDFGISREVEKANATMSQKGTKSYMAPEMIRMGKYGINVDLYALGLTMYELLNHGRMPFLPPYPQPFFPNDREEAMFKRLNGEEFPEIEGIGKLNDIIKKACHYDPNLRYQSASEMKEDLISCTKSTFEEEKTALGGFEKDEEEKTSVGGFNLFEEEKTVLGGSGLFEEEKTILGGSELFEEKKTQKEFVSNSEDKTVGVFSNKFMFEDTTVIETKATKNEPSQEYTIKCPYCGGKAHKVFTNAYHCNTEGCYKVHLTVNDEIGRKRLAAYSKQLNDRKIDSALTLVNLDPQSANAYIHLSRRYEENNQKAQALQNAIKAYELDSNDAYMSTRLGYLYGEMKNYESAVYYFLEGLHHIKENRNSGFKTIQDIYLNLSVYSKALGFDAIASYYLKKTFENGYDSTELRDYQLGWKIGNVYMRDVIERNVIKNNNISLNGRSDQASLKKARGDVNIPEKEEVLYALGPVSSGLFKGKKIEKFNFVFTQYTFNVRDVNNKLWYFSYFALFNHEYSADKEYVIVKINDKTYKVHIGKDAPHLVDALNKIKNEVLNNKIGSEETHTYKCPKCGKIAHKAFTHGYHCGECKSIFVTRQDPNTNNANEVYLKYVHENSLINAQELVKADPFSANAYLYLASEYKKRSNNQSWLKNVRHAYALDPIDAHTNNRMALWYSEQKDNQKAYSYISEAIKQYEANHSSMHNPTYLYVNYATIVQPLGRSKEALAYIAKAKRKGHDVSDLNSYVAGWGIGKAYVDPLVKGIVSQNSMYMSGNSILSNFDKVRSDLKVNDKLDIYYAVSYNGQYNFCINSRGVDYRCVKNGLREISFYAFNFGFRKEGQNLVFDTSTGIRSVPIGQDIDIVLKMLNEIKELLNKEIR